MVSVRVSGSLFTGNRVTFTCSVEVSVSILSTVRPVVTWRRGTAQLFNNSRTNVSKLVSTGSTSLFESNLTINSIEAADSGNYTCETTLVSIATNNVVARNSSLVSIVVEGEPDICHSFHFMLLLFVFFLFNVYNEIIIGDIYNILRQCTIVVTVCIHALHAVSLCTVREPESVVLTK